MGDRPFSFLGDQLPKFLTPKSAIVIVLVVIVSLALKLQKRRPSSAVDSTKASSKAADAKEERVPGGASSLLAIPSKNFNQCSTQSGHREFSNIYLSRRALLIYLTSNRFLIGRLDGVNISKSITLFYP